MIRRSTLIDQSGRRTIGKDCRLSGRTGLTILFEILLIAAVCWAVVESLVFSLNFGPSAAPNKRMLGIPIQQLELTSDGEELWVKRGRHEILSFNLKTQETKPIHLSESSPLGAWAVSRDGSTWFHLDHNSELSIYRNHELIVSYQITRHPDIAGYIQPICLLSSDGRTAACILNRAEVRCWDLSQREPILSRFVLPEPGHKIAMDPGGRLIASTHQGTIQAYDCKTGAVAWTLPGTRPLSRPPVFSTDGDWMVVSHGSDVERYDTKTGRKIWTVENHESDLVCSMAISPDGRRLAVSRVAGGIRILGGWTGNDLGPCFRDSAMHHVAFSAVSDRLFSADPFGSLQVWSLFPSVESNPISLSY